jgi:hypothetical protein
MDWHTAAMRLGEHLASDGPNGYGNFTPKQWLEWAQRAAKQLRAAK